MPLIDLIAEVVELFVAHGEARPEKDKAKNPYRRFVRFCLAGLLLLAATVLIAWYGGWIDLLLGS